MLRDIILGEEKDRLHRLDWRVSDLESRTSDIAEVLPAAMSRLAGDPASQPDFEKPVVSTIRNAIKRDTHSFAEALFPVLGPAIRRAVADALKGLVQRINVALENSFTVKGLRWRVEAARSGVPFAQIVLRHTMVYAIQEAFLIQRGTGLVLASVHRDETLALDEDAVAAMLTAIQSFIQDSFGSGMDEPLRSAELGDQTMWVINGPVAVLACVITGTPPRSVRDDLMTLLEMLHARYARQFREKPELLAHNEGLQALMTDALLEEADEEIRNSNRFKYRIMWIGGAILLLGYLIFSSWSVYQGQQFKLQVSQILNAEPGYVLTSAVMQDGVLQVSGLRDPWAQPVESLLLEHQLNAQNLHLTLRPYQSLDAGIVVSRLREHLGISPDTALDLDDSHLQVSGRLSAAQWVALESLPGTHPLIRSVGLATAVLSPEEAVDMIRTAMAAPDSVTITADQGRMLVAGISAPHWFRNARAQAAAGAYQTMGWTLDFGPLESSLGAQMEQLFTILNGRKFLFRNGTTLTAESADDLAVAAGQIEQMMDLAEALRQEVIITLEGLGDGIGTFEKNRQVSRDRTDRVLEGLVSDKTRAGAVIHTQGPWEEGGLNPDRRKVTLRLTKATAP